MTGDQALVIGRRYGIGAFRGGSTGTHPTPFVDLIVRQGGLYEIAIPKTGEVLLSRNLNFAVLVASLHLDGKTEVLP